MSAVNRKASRYYKNSLEWVWLIVSLTYVLSDEDHLSFAPTYPAVSALIGVPIAVYYLALNNLPNDDENNDNNDKDGHHINPSFDRYWKARAISFGTWIALMVLVFVPMHMWKNSVSQLSEPPYRQLISSAG